MTKLYAIKTQFKKAVDRLDEVLNAEKNEITRDSAIKRFEFTFDLSWKLIKSFIKDEHNADCFSPKSCFKAAYKYNLIEYDEYWLEMCSMRNLSAHTYNEESAEEIYDELPKILKFFKKLADAIQ